METRINVAGVDIEWHLPDGVLRWGGGPSIAIWLETSVAGLMSGMQRMVGTERFNLCMQTGGRDSVDGDWRLISSYPTFEQGFEAWSAVIAASGWGRWELVALDRAGRSATFRGRSTWESVYQRALGVAWGTSYFAGKLAGFCGHLFGEGCWAEQTAYEVAGDAYDEIVVRPSDRTVERQVEELLRSDSATRADLAVALERLRCEIDERRDTERDLREKLDVIRRQEEAIRALSTPILQVWDGVLAMPLIGVLDSRRAAGMMEDLLAQIVKTASRHAILDLTGVDVVDTEVADHLLKVVRAVELLGARVVITGIAPAVAQTMTSLGVDLSRLTTRSNLQEGLKHCIAEAGGKPVRSRSGP